MPAQCPECGRFLAAAFVQGLAVEPASCPKCDVVLDATRFPGELGNVGDVTGATEEPAAAAQLRDEEVEAVGQLDPGTPAPAAPVEETSTSPDPLDGWDQPDARVLDLDQYRDHRSPPPDAAVLAGATGFGALLGALMSQRRVRGALVGAGLGATAAAVARRVWELDA